jgi:CBS domain-containing protein
MRQGGIEVAQSIREVMTRDPVSLPAATKVTEAATQMKRHDIGDVIVLEDSRVCGVVTDRDIVIRALAEGRDPASTTLGDICSRKVVTLTPTSSIEDATILMRDHALRRLPVVEDGAPVGIVSIGDLAVERDPASALADISAAPGNT